MARIEIRTLSRPAAVDVRHALGQLAGVLALFSLGVLGVAVRVLVYTPM